jgi:hypothetical protein
MLNRRALLFTCSEVSLSLSNLRGCDRDPGVRIDRELRRMLKIGTFEEKIVNALTNGTDDVYCSEMSLVQSTEENPISYRGPGYLRRDAENNSIAFKIFAVESENAPILHILPLNAKPGQLLGESSFFELSACDEYGREWRGKHILPDMHGLQTIGNEDAKCHVIAGGNVRELKSTSQWSLEPEKLQVLILRFLCDVDFPFNEATQVFTTIAGGSEEKHWKANVSKFSSLGCSFIIEKEEGIFQVEVRTGDSFPPHFDVRIIETLQFVLARTITWQTLAYWDNDTLTVRLNSSTPKSRTARFKPPITEQHARLLGSHHFYNLFDKYLRFVSNSEVAEWHACSKLLHQATQSGSNSIQLVALGFGVVVEGLVKEFFEEFKSDSASLDTAVEALMSHNEIWDTLPGWSDKDFRQKRIAKALKSLRRTSTADRLYQLANIGAVERRLVNRWKEVRHPAAHGVSLGNDIQNTIDSIHAVNMLIHQLIFFLIDYQGCYVDFSTHGYPHASYPLKAANK